MKLQWIVSPVVFGMIFSGNARIAVMGDLSHERVSAPGETYSGTIVVRNLEDFPEEVKIYQTDYLFNCEGKSFYDEPGNFSRSNAGWITFSPKRLLIPPKEEMSIQFVVQVPASDSLFGTYWSVLMVEPVPRSSLESALPERTLGVQTVVRYAIQVATHIGDTGTKKMRFMQSQLLRDREKRIFQVDIENTGDRMLRPSMMLQIFDMEGKEYGPFESEPLRVNPGTSVRHRFDVTSLPKGKYKALVVADCGEEDLFGIHYALEIQ